MIDIHCHILPGIDDGSPDLVTTMAMLKNAADAGVTDMILTPHYIKNTRYAFNNASKEAILNIIKTATEQAGIPINLYLGNEIFYDLDIRSMSIGRKIASLNDSRYVLIEFPVQNEDKTAKDTLFKLICDGYVPIIAHPERYPYFQNGLKKIDEYRELGCLMQGDYLSLSGRYGKHAERALKRFLKAGKIDVLASDVHKPTDKYWLDEAYKMVDKLTKKQAAKLLEDTPRRILNDEVLA